MEAGDGQVTQGIFLSLPVSRGPPLSPSVSRRDRKQTTDRRPIISFQFSRTRQFVFLVEHFRHEGVITYPAKTTLSNISCQCERFVARVYRRVTAITLSIRHLPSVLTANSMDQLRLHPSCERSTRITLMRQISFILQRLSENALISRSHRAF